MKRKRELAVLLFSALVGVLAFVFIDHVQSGSENPNWSEVVFYVS